MNPAVNTRSLISVKSNRFDRADRPSKGIAIALSIAANAMPLRRKNTCDQNDKLWMTRDEELSDPFAIVQTQHNNTGALAQEEMMRFRPKLSARISIGLTKTVDISV
jgi:hypothetical protein